jgi:hypothetical protein
MAVKPGEFATKVKSTPEHRLSGSSLGENSSNTKPRQIQL